MKSPKELQESLLRTIERYHRICNETNAGILQVNFRNMESFDGASVFILYVKKGEAKDFILETFKETLDSE